jgi:hypothetical protein
LGIPRKTDGGEGGDVDERPVTRYATTPDGVSIAYQVTGDGPLDLVFLSAYTIPIDLLWEEPSFVRVAKRLGGFSRTVWCDARGHGASGGNLEDHFFEETADALGRFSMEAAYDEYRYAYERIWGIHSTPGVADEVRRAWDRLTGQDH